MQRPGVEALAWKRVSPVEVDPSRSRQHEFHAGGLHAILGRPVGKDTHAAKYHYWRSEHPRPVTASSTFTFYDARENTPSRTELRLYYPSNEVTRLAGPGDLFLIEFGSSNTANVHIVKNGSPRCSSLAARLSQINGPTSNVLRVFEPHTLEEAEHFQEVLQHLPNAGVEDEFEREVEMSTLVTAVTYQLISNGERPTRAQIMAAVQTVQALSWPSESADATVSKCMILERYVHQEVEVLRLYSHTAEKSHSPQQLRSAVRISASYLHSSKLHLEHAFVFHVLSVLEKVIGETGLSVSQLSPAASVVRIKGAQRSTETIVLVCEGSALRECMTMAQGELDWVLTETFPDQGDLQELVGANPSVKIGTLRSGRASDTPPNIWGPDLDTFLLPYIGSSRVR